METVLTRRCARKRTSSTVPSGRMGSRLDCGRWRSQLSRFASAFLTREEGEPPAMSPAPRAVPRMRAASMRYAKEEKGSSFSWKHRSSYSWRVRGCGISYARVSSIYTDV